MNLPLINSVAECQKIKTSNNSRIMKRKEVDFADALMSVKTQDASLHYSVHGTPQTALDKTQAFDGIQKVDQEGSGKTEQAPIREGPAIMRVPLKDNCPQVKTARQAKKTKKVDLSRIDIDDLEHTKAEDPFLYYSIFGVRSATLLMKDIDLPSVQDSKQTVTRSSCISFECYPDLLLEDLYDDTNIDEDESPGKDPFDALIALFNLQKLK